LSPERADVRHRLALAYLTVGRTADAIASWREAVRLDPKFEEAYFTMGVVLAANGRREEARQAFQEVLKINPEREDAKQALAALGR
jgi:Tfp pilus assembly protein PilF